VNYDFKKRYYLSASIRNDGSSRFGVNKKYGTFPSVSVAWIASDEKFFPKWDVLNFLKFRGSYGKTGNFNIGNYTQTSLLSPANYGNTTLGEGNTVLGNPDLTWETSKQFDVGADITLLRGRVNISYDYYNTRNEGMLYPLPLPYTSGYESIQYNEGSFHIFGHDIQVSTENIKGPFTWNTDFNISFNDNRVVSLVNGTPIGGVNTYSDYNRTAVGHRIGELYGYVFEGVYMNQADFDKYPKYSTSAVGSARMLDVNGDDTIDIKDRTFLGRTNPTFIYGMTNTFAWKGFDLGIIIAGQVGARAIIGPVVVQGMAYVGKNLAPFVANLVQFQNDDRGNVHEWGAWGQLGFNFTPEWSVWGFAGTSDPNDQDIRNAGLTRVQNRTYSGMLRYLQGGFMIGLEWLHWVTNTINAAGASTGSPEANQYMITGAYTF